MHLKNNGCLPSWSDTMFKLKLGKLEKNYFILTKREIRSPSNQNYDRIWYRQKYLECGSQTFGRSRNWGKQIFVKNILTNIVQTTLISWMWLNQVLELPLLKPEYMGFYQLVLYYQFSNDLIFFWYETGLWPPTTAWRTGTCQGTSPTPAWEDTFARPDWYELSSTAQACYVFLIKRETFGHYLIF